MGKYGEIWGRSDEKEIGTTQLFIIIRIAIARWI